MANFKTLSVMFLYNMPVSLSPPLQAPTPIVPQNWTNHSLPSTFTEHLFCATPCVRARKLNKNNTSNLLKRDLGDN